MTKKTNTHESDVLRWIFNPAISILRPDAVYIAFFTSDPGEAGSVVGEPNGNGYARFLCPFATTQLGYVANATDIISPVSSGAWGLLTHVGVCRGSARGVADLMYYGPLTTPVNVNAADLSVRFIAGNLTVSEKALFSGLSAALQGNATLVGDGTVSGSSPLVFPNLSFTPPTGMSANGTGTVFATNYPTVTGASIVCTNDAQFTAALASATYGDEIVLQAGAIFSPKHLPAKGAYIDNNFIVVRSSRLNEIPENQTEIKQADVDNKFAIIRATNVNQRCITFDRAVKGWWFAGIKLENTASGNHEDALVETTPDSGLNGDTNNHSRYIVFDRIYIPEKVTGCRRGIGMNGKYIAVIHSYIEGINDVTNAHSQAIATWNGPGPYKIYDVFLEAATENIIYGGAPPEIATEVPSDIEIQYCHLFKRQAWIDNKSAYSIANSFEVKDAQRLLLQFCVFENGTYDTQQNMVVLSSHNQSNDAGHAPHNRCQDLAIRFNIIRNQPALFNIGAHGNTNSVVGAQRIEISNNFQWDPIVQEVDNNAFTLNLGEVLPSIHFFNNTLQPAHSALYGDQFPTNSTDFKYIDNIIAAPTTYGIFFGEAGSESVGLNNRLGVGNWTVKNNVFINYALDATLLNAPNNNKNSPSLANIGFTNLAGHNPKLLNSSPYKGTGTGGIDPGINYDILSVQLSWYEG